MNCCLNAGRIGWTFGEWAIFFLVNLAIAIIETKVHGPLFIDLWIDFMLFIAWNDQPHRIQSASVASPMIWSTKWSQTFEFVHSGKAFQQSTITSTHIGIQNCQIGSLSFEIWKLKIDLTSCILEIKGYATDESKTPFWMYRGKQVNNN